MLLCEACGGANGDHEDCGAYEVEDPPGPTGADGDIKLAGIERLR